MPEIYWITYLLVLIALYPTHSKEISAVLTILGHDSHIQHVYSARPENVSRNCFSAIEIFVD